MPPRADGAQLPAAYILGYLDSSKARFIVRGPRPRIEVAFRVSDEGALRRAEVLVLRRAEAFRERVGGLGSISPDGDGVLWTISEPAELRSMCSWILDAHCGSQHPTPGQMIWPSVKKSRALLDRLEAEAPAAPAPAGGSSGGAGTSSAPGGGGRHAAGSAGSAARCCAACGAQRGAGGVEKLYRHAERWLAGCR